eukprot:381334-Pyramimonas_sp.AAC.1
MEPEKADLESKSLQDLHLRKTKKSKQLEKASERVAAAREAQLAAKEALEKELECERAHKEALSEIKEVIRKKELANAVPVLSKVGEGKHDEATAVELLGFMQELLGKLQSSEHFADMAAPVTAFCGALDQQRAALQAKAAAQQAEAKRQAEEAAKQAGGGNDAGGVPSTGPAGNNADADDGFDWEDPDLGERLKAAGFPDLDPSKIEDRDKLKRRAVPNVQQCGLLRGGTNASGTTFGIASTRARTSTHLHQVGLSSPLAPDADLEKRRSGTTVLEDLDIVTANVTAWSKAQDLCAWYEESGSVVTTPSAFLFQEHRLKLDKQIQTAGRWASKNFSGGQAMFGKADSTGAGVLESSGGVAIAAFFPLLAREVPPNLRKDLPASRCKVVAINTGLAVPVYLVSVYLTTKIGLAEPNISFLGGLMQLVCCLPGPWIIGGDWNMDPSDLYEWAKRAGGVQAYTAEFTCGSRTLDFFICSKVLANLGMVADVVLGTPIATHTPVVLKLRGLNSRAMATVADGPEGFPLQLPPPSRPAPREVDDDEWLWLEGTLPADVQPAVECWFRHAEDYLCHLHDVYERRRGRAVGLRVKRVPLAIEWS